MKTAKLALCSMLAAFVALPASLTLAQDAAVPAYLEVRDVARGDVQTFSYHSSSLDREREVVVYLPPGYETSGESYPVLYLLHGAGGDERSWVEREQAPVILDNLIADGRLRPLIVVMPYGYTTRLEEGQRRRGAADYKQDMEEFAVDFIADLIPQIESSYRVRAERAQRAVAGLSMGGGQSLAIGLSNPELFSAVAGFSSAMQIANSPDWGGVDMEAVLADADTINENIDLLWVGCGTDDTLFNVNTAFSEQLTAHGIEHTFRVTLGGHTADVWSRYLHEVAPQLF